MVGGLAGATPTVFSSLKVSVLQRAVTIRDGVMDARSHNRTAQNASD
jgi:hypothetical protein